MDVLIYISKNDPHIEEVTYYDDNTGQGTKVESYTVRKAAKKRLNRLLKKQENSKTKKQVTLLK